MALATIFNSPVSPWSTGGGSWSGIGSGVSSTAALPAVVYQPSTTSSQPTLTYTDSFQQFGQQVLLKRGASTDPQIQEDRALVALIPQTQPQPPKSASQYPSTGSTATPDSVKTKNALDAYAKTSSGGSTGWTTGPAAYSPSADVTLGRRA